MHRVIWNTIQLAHNSKKYRKNREASNQPVHLTPKARAFFSLAFSEQNVAFAKSSLAFGAGDQHVVPIKEMNQGINIITLKKGYLSKPIYY